MAWNELIQMKKLLPTIIIALFVAMASSAWAGQGVVVGGYDVEKLAADTISALESGGVITKAEAGELCVALPTDQPQDTLMASPAVIGVFDRIGTVLMVKDVALASDVESFNKAAAESGGLKIAGRNPVVLAASYLDLLARKGVISLQKAQFILDTAKNP